MKKFLSLLLVLLLALCLAACGTEGGEEGEPTGGDDQPKTAAEHQEEILAAITPDESVTGTLVIVSPNSEGEQNAILPGFRAKYPNVDVQIIPLGSGDAVARIVAEAANPTIDVMWGGLGGNVLKAYPDLFMKYTSPNEGNVYFDCAKNETVGQGIETYYGLSGNACFIINTQKLEELGLTLADITGYQSILDHADKLTGNVLMGDVAKSSSALNEYLTMVYIYGNGFDTKDWNQLDIDKAWDEYVYPLLDVIQGEIITSSSQVYNNVIAGEAAIGLSYEDPCVQAIKDEAPNIAILYPCEGANWVATGAGIVNNCPNVEIAKLFVDFLISDEGQELYSCTTVRTSSGKPNIYPNYVDITTFEKLFDMDTEWCTDHTDEQRALWNDRLEAWRSEHGK